jgi:hypothetical protein
VNPAPESVPEASPARRGEIARFAAVMSLVALTLLPMLASGFYGDDEFNSLFTATLLSLKGQSLPALMASDIAGWATTVGRFFPLSEYTRVLFWVADGNALTYKLVLMALVLLDAALLYALLRRLTGSTGLAAVSVLAFSLTLQFRYYHEPILSYAGMLPVITALILAALLWFLRYLDSGSRRWLAVSVAAFVATLLIYEVALPMCLVFVALAAVYPRGRTLARALRASWAYLAAAVIAVADIAVLRLVFQFQPRSVEQLSGYQPDFSPLPVVITVVKQMVAALPLTYYAGRMTGGALGLLSRPLYDSPLAYLRAHPYTSVLGAALFFAVGLLVLRPLLSREPHTSSAAVKGLVVVGLGFLVLPNTLIALAVKHQTGIAWSEGYLPVYMSSVGVAILVGAAVDRAARSSMVRRHAGSVALALALVVGLVGAINLDNNRVTVEAMNRTRSYPAHVTAQALSAGLLAPVPQGAWVLSNMETPWQSADFYALYAGKSLAGARPLVDPGSLPGLPLRASASRSGESTSYVVDPGGPPVYYLYVENGARDAGYVLLSRVESATVSREGVTVSGTPLRAYRAWPRPPSYDWQQIRGWPLRPASYERPDTAGPALSAGAVLASGRDWALQSVPAGWIVEETGFDTRRGHSWLDSAGPLWSRVQP